MAVTINDIKKLRDMTGAGLSDCKKALIEAENDMDKAMELIRKRGQAIAAKREDRNAAQGISIGKSAGDFAAIVALKCETDFVAKNEKFVTLAKCILDAAVAARAKNMDEVNALTIDGKSVPEAITALSGITGEKMELGAYECIEAPSTVCYNHFNGMLAALVGFNQAEVDSDVAKGIAMQVASMNPIKATREQIPQSTIDSELQLAIDKSKAEQVQKAVEVALKKAGFNAYYCATEEHQEEAVRKGIMTAEQLAQAKKIMADTAAEKEANMDEKMIQNIAKGRLNKFFQENVLMEQVYEAGENKETVAQFLAKSNKDLKAIDLRRVNLNVD
ncbi:MAG: elongation factor Ts [Muribaculaceae bacterium]|nr:elongation factor Ts [Muribaculaceae bacterium]